MPNAAVRSRMTHRALVERNTVPPIQLPPTTLVRDSFTGPNGTPLENHAPDIGGLWVKIQGPVSATIQSNKLNRVTNAFITLYVNTASPARDFEMSFVLSARAGGYIGFVTHRQANGDYYYAVYNGDDYQISKIVGGVPTSLVTLTESAPSLPATFMLKVREGDEYLRLLVNGVEKVATNDATLAGGLSGFLIQGFGATTVIDDFLLEATTEAEIASSGLGSAGEELVPVWETHIAALPCFLYTPRGRDTVETTGVVVLEAPTLLVPWGTDITESDRVNGVNDRQGNVYRAGIFVIQSIVEVHDHLEVALREVQ